MRKRIIGDSGVKFHERSPWLDLEKVAEVEVTSEDPDHTIERALAAGSTSGWRANEPGEQRIRLIFDEPHDIDSLRLVFQEDQLERRQEFSFYWTTSETDAPQEILRQQFNFSPHGATQEREQFAVTLRHVKVLELRIDPDRSNHTAYASLEEFRVA